MQRDLEAYLWDIFNAIEQVERFVAGLTFEAYLDSELPQAGVERKFEIIGEAIKQASQHFPGRLDTLPNLSNFARFRDRLAHGYATIKQEIVWEAIQDDIPPLKQAVAKLLHPGPNSDLTP
ncbi:DUF86 domain-containing protein [Granulicella sp. 5B5]|uniref:HepT-like ribonuclease domain-containing protein n=1 Tax=Granulicella sp. 5B5 TaxID=1617967 RepID=UPI0015F4115F|nr:HepT-like ribonuclease domain-containing protein [Granulicella sp. 5B5]QMV18556.1 DUF86 domain-containing protein [Granulicella sp. 5B5]